MFKDGIFVISYSPTIYTISELGQTSEYDNKSVKNLLLVLLLRRPLARCREKVLTQGTSIVVSWQDTRILKYLHPKDPGHCT